MPDVGTGPKLATIKAEPALKLAMPNARQVGVIERDRVDTLEGRFAAFAGADFETSATSDAVFAYYDSGLVALGWTRDRSPILATIEAAGRAWCKPRMVFSVTIFDPKPAALRGITIPAGNIRYQAGILGTAGTCPEG